MDELTIKHENAPAAAAQAELLAAFVTVARQAIEERDDAAIFNLAIDFTLERKLSAPTMGGLLSVLRRRGEVSPELMRQWAKEAATVLREEHQVALPDRRINEEILIHSTEADWQHRAVVKELITWFDLLNSEFFGAHLPTSAISVERGRRRALGWYQPRQDGLGLRYRIALNEAYLHRPLADRLRTLLHEMLHLQEELDEGRDRGGSYHSVWFRRQSDALGIPCDDRGRSAGIVPDGRFARFLRGRGVPLDGSDARRPTVERRTRVSLIPWICDCDTRIWSAAGTVVDGRCERCGEKWKRAQ